MFEQSLNEENEADGILTSVAESSVNISTAAGESELEGDVRESSVEIY